MTAAAQSGGSMWPVASSAVRLWLLLFFAVISLVVAVRTVELASKPAGTIDIESVEIARDLFRSVQSHVLTPNTAAHDRPPGLALVLMLAAVADDKAERGLSCSLNDRAACRPSLFASVLVANYVLAIAIYVLILAIAWRLSRAWDVCLITLALAFIAMRPAEMAGLVRPMIWYQALLALYLLLALLAHQKQSVSLAFAAGGALGLSALFEPLTILVLPIAIVLCVSLPNDEKEQPLRPARRAAALAAGAMLGCALLVCAVNLSYDLNGTLRHIGRHLAAHTAFSNMELGTWLVALISPIPLVGDWLQSLLAGMNVARTDSFVSRNMVQIFERAMAEGGSPPGAVGWMLREHTVGQMGAYLWSLPPIVSQGLWAGGGVVALFGLFHVRRALAYARVDNRHGELLVVVVPLVALFIINTLLTGNAFWLNPMLAFVYCYAIAAVASGM